MDNSLDKYEMEPWMREMLDKYAKHIRKCVELHDELTDALSDALEFMRVVDDPEPDHALLERMNALLSKAKDA